MKEIDKPFLFENFNPDKDIKMIKYKNDIEVLETIQNKISKMELIQFLILNSTYALIIICCLVLLYLGE